MQALRDSGENRATLRAGFIAHSNDVMEMVPTADKVESRLRLVLRDIDPHFSHGRYDDGVKFTRFNARALGFKHIRTSGVQKSLRHLAARAVMDANEKSFLLHP